MRVTGGQLVGRRLRVPRGDRVRPTADRVRESLFSHLVHRRGFEGRRVLDAFAGSGALGIEALSRGADHAVFVEQSLPVLKVLKANLETLDLDDVSRVIRGDARSALKRLAGSGERFDWVFLDPPYGSEALADVMACLPKLLEEDGQAWVETSRQDPLPSPVGLAILDAREYGETRMTGLAIDASADTHPETESHE